MEGDRTTHRSFIERYKGTPQTPQGYFSVARRCMRLYMELEKVGYVIPIWASMATEGDADIDGTWLCKLPQTPQFRVL